MFMAPRGIPFSQRVPLFPSPKPRVAPQDQTAASIADDYPADPGAQAEWHENKLKQLYKQSMGVDDELSVSNPFQTLCQYRNAPLLLALNRGCIH